MRRAPLLLALLGPATLVALACQAHARGGNLNTGTHDFSISGDGFETTARITARNVLGPQIDVGRYDDGKTFRGTAFDRPVDLSIHGDSVRGEWGRVPFTLDVNRSGQRGFDVTGLIAGVPSTFSVGTERIQGTIGHCAYELQEWADTYVGTRSCRGGIQSVTLRFPQSVSSWPDSNLAVLVALLLPEV